MSAAFIKMSVAALLTPPQLSTRNCLQLIRRDAVLGGTAALIAGSCAKAEEPPYRVALTVLLDRQTKTEGRVILEVLPDWAPLAAARFKELVELGFYTRSRFHRVLPGFLPGDLAIAQFGISTSRELNQEWLCATCKRLPDEKRRQSNTKGTVSFAQASQPGTRQTQVFINLADNGGLPNFLDNQNFTPFARVVNGMEYLTRLRAESQVSQPKAAYYCEEYLDEVFPQLSLIEDAALSTS